ncbi:substrate-binding periplasmic protein [Dongshaea marina]|uniref:substrate-binding periplasmic protein n=1 Tax=Dongshaea marina TaxID=2047966 RepID=UPI00131F210D|nr:transporter substrate-binding domain-containing protein [Dongshaea marina]
MRLIIILAMSLICWPTAAQSVRAVSDLWQGYFNSDGSGYYADILHEVFHAPEYQLSIDPEPFEDSIESVSEKKADLVMGIARTDKLPGLILSHYPLEEERFDLILSATFAKQWKSLASLKGKRLIGPVGYSMDLALKIPLKYSESNDLVKQLKQLRANEVDAVIGYAADYEALSEFDIKPEPRVIINAFSDPTFVGFSDTSKGAALKKHFDTNYKKVVCSGKLRFLMKKNLDSLDEYPKFSLYPRMCI